MLCNVGFNHMNICATIFAPRTMLGIQLKGTSLAWLEHIYLHTCTYFHMCTDMLTHMQTCICTCTGLWTQAHIPTHIYSNVHTHIHTCIHAFISTHATCAQPHHQQHKITSFPPPPTCQPCSHFRGEFDKDGIDRRTRESKVTSGESQGGLCGAVRNVRCVSGHL